MRKLCLALVGLAMLCGRLCAQGVLEPHPYMQQGVVKHHDGAATVKADHARPLNQAVAAVREEYGWTVNYEDPPYQSKYGVMDMTNPKYRAEHPDAPVRLGPAGGAFQSTYPETPSMWNSSATEQQVLEKVVSDYNKSGNPGNFTVSHLPDGNFDVIGDSIHNDTGAGVHIVPILDTPIYIPRATLSGYGVIQAILNALSAKTGVHMGIGLAPDPLLGQAKFTLGGSNASARALLMQVMDGLGRKYVWEFIYEPEPPEYILVLLPVVRAEYGAFGEKRLIPVGPVAVPGGTQ